MSNPLRLLIVDDHAGLVRAVSRLLAMHYDVVGSVADGRGALEAAKRLQPDVIVLDVNLPDMDGLTVCRQLTQCHAAIKVIIFTAMNEPELKRRAFEVGAADFVHKLAAGDELLAAIKRLDDKREQTSG
jgi:DNA-binding response OmpR family regulator